MEVKIEKKGEQVLAIIKGRIDSSTAQKLNDILAKAIRGTKTMILDFKNVDFISSAGLRVILASSKALKDQNGNLKIINVSPIIAEVFDMTGFSEVIDID